LAGRPTTKRSKTGYPTATRLSCRKNGLLISAEEDVLMLFPALTITRETAQRGLDIFEKSL
jgi:4-aminobutyrate aminotransferase-like enzyme